MWEQTKDVKINFTYYYPCNYIPQNLINCYKIKIFTFYLILKLNFPQESSFVAYQVNLSVIIPSLSCGMMNSMYSAGDSYH